MASKKITRSERRVDQTTTLLDRTLTAAVEGITGVAASEKRALLLSLGHILQRIRGGQFLSQLKAEWEDYQDMGKVKDDYIDTNQHQECFQELLDFLDGNSPDQLRFDALKRIFLKAATEEESERDSVLPQQYMRMVRSLSAGEAILLFSAYGFTDALTLAQAWLTQMAKSSQLQFPELVELHEEGLMKKQLLTQRQHSDKAGHSAPAV